MSLAGATRSWGRKELRDGIVVAQTKIMALGWKVGIGRHELSKFEHYFLHLNGVTTDF